MNGLTKASASRGSARRQEGPQRLRGVAGLPQPSVGHGESSRQPYASTVRLRGQRLQLRVSRHGRTPDDGHKVDQIPVPGRRPLVDAVALKGRYDLVGDVIDERIGAVAPLLEVGHCHPGERRDVLRIPRHPDVRADQVDSELLPERRSHVVARTLTSRARRAAAPLTIQPSSKTYRRSRRRS